MKKAKCDQCQRDRWVQTTSEKVEKPTTPKQPKCFSCKRKNKVALRMGRKTFFVRTKPRKSPFKKGRKRQ
jgi:hypothetical protein